MKNLFSFIQSVFNWILKLYIRITQIRPDDTPAEEMATTILIFFLGAVVVALSVWLAYEMINASSIPELVHKP
ncbi:MAG: hypothetical protein WBN66_02250 [Smithella sp.]